MQPPSVETFLARLYSDALLRARFLADPIAVARAEGFDEETARRLASIDRPGLELAVRSLARKRKEKREK